MWYPCLDHFLWSLKDMKITERIAPTPRRARGSPISIALKPMQRPTERPRTAVVKEAKTRVRGRALLRG